MHFQRVSVARASAVDAGGRALRKRQVDVGSSDLEGFKELFQVFSLTQRHVTPDGNCMPLSVAEASSGRLRGAGH